MSAARELPSVARIRRTAFRTAARLPCSAEALACLPLPDTQGEPHKKHQRRRAARQRWFRTGQNSGAARSCVEHSIMVAPLDAAGKIKLDRWLCPGVAIRYGFSESPSEWPLENAGLPLATPSDEVRGVKAFTALQGADGTRLSGGGIGLSQNPQFVLSGEGATLGIGDHLRVWPRRAGWLGRAGFACRCTPVGLASLVLPTFSGRQNRGRSRRYSVVLHIDSCSRPAQ